jgi:cytochrome c556
VKLTRVALAGWLVVGLAGFFVVLADEDPPSEHVQWMKDIGKANGAMKKGVDVEANANKMASVGVEVEKWWSARQSEVAVKTSRDMQAAAKKVAELHKAGAEEQAIRAALKEAGASCQGCHEAHRVRISDGVYKIK